MWTFDFAYNIYSNDMIVSFQIIGILMEIDKMKTEYEKQTSDLLQWIENTIVTLSDRTFPNTLKGMHTLMSDFKTYRTMEKPLKYVY